MSNDRHEFPPCEREALHLSGAIQPHGSLLVVDAGGTVTHVAANCQALAGRSPDALLGSPLPPSLATVVAGLGTTPGSRQYAVVSVGEWPAGSSGTSPAACCDVVVTRGSDGAVLLELMARSAEGRVPVARLPVVAGTIPDDDDAAQLVDTTLVERIADLTGFQRVMYYRFRDDGDGEVVAEARRGDAYGSYLGLRYPASDIPGIARALYLKNPWRLIADAVAEPVPIVGAQPSAHLAVQPGVPDLSYSDLRSVSPVHRAYLANMGVRASLSFPVSIRGDLVALVAAHHREVRTPTLADLERCSTLVRSHAITVSLFQSQESMRIVDGLVHRCREIAPMLQSPQALVGQWSALGPWLLHEFRADGAILAFDGVERRDGACGGGASPLADLDEWFRGTRAVTVATVDNLGHAIGRPGEPDVAGALGLRVPIPRLGDLRVYLTRREYVHDVAWGGNPEKPMETDAGELPVSPRRSFEKWVEKRRGYCRSWDRQDRLVGLNLRNALDAAFGVGRART